MKKNRHRESLAALAAHADKGPLLVVEPQESLRLLLRVYLRRQGYRVHAADRRRRAAAILDAEEIRLVLLDMQLPRGDSYALLQELQRRAPRRLPYVIAMGAKVAPAERQAALDLGANEHLAKPFYLTRLLERIEALDAVLA